MPLPELEYLAAWEQRKAALAKEEGYSRHNHCKNCGACLKTGTAHRCSWPPIQADIARVMHDDIRRVQYSRQDKDFVAWQDRADDFDDWQQAQD